jgi:hypothetical protein
MADSTIPPVVTVAQALAAAQSAVTASGRTGVDAGRIVAEFLDTWASRWQFAPPTGTGKAAGT